MSDQPEHILIVDDDREIRRLLQEYLTQSGYRVTDVGDGRAIRKALDEYQIDLIVLDLMLPGEDGLSLCRTLRTRSNIPVLMLTARGPESQASPAGRERSERGARGCTGFKHHAKVHP